MLPTGYGKSIIFQLISGVCQFLYKKGFDYPPDPILFVICPLIALISSHLEELMMHGISAHSLSDKSLNLEDLKAGKFSIVFASPEAMLDNKTWRKMLQSELYQKNVFGMVTDEAQFLYGVYRICSQFLYAL